MSTHEACAASLLNHDTLIEIFHACVELESESCASTLATDSAPWVLGHVCQSWRRAALSSPLLWTSIHVSLDNLDSAAQSRTLFLLDLYLSRSASCPLSVSIHSSKAFQKSPSFLRPLLSASARWHQLEMDIPVSSYAAFSALTGFLDLLETLHVRLPHQNKTQAVHDFANLKDGVRLFRFCNNLKYLSLQDIPYPRDVFHLPWARLQDLSVYSSSTLVTNFTNLRALHGLRNLTSCSLECRSTMNARKPQNLTLPALRSMTLLSVEHDQDLGGIDVCRMGIVQMLSWLTLPALNHLRLYQSSGVQSEAENSSEDDLVDQIIQLIRRSHCETEGLQLQLYPSVNEAGMKSILDQILPSPERLTLAPHSAYRPYCDRISMSKLFRRVDT
ncbi:hypothetical protein C8R42DRAFT_2420 [Lentinula raphanica]|nr:hypothetical protein C8R42DRAFT_2420 [Lentinula raphanica]